MESGPLFRRVDVRPQVVPAYLPLCGGLNSQRQPRTGLAPAGRYLPEIAGVGANQPCQGDAPGHIFDIGMEVHARQTIALCYLSCNSILRADPISSPLHDCGVGTISEIKRLRRHNLATIRSERGAAKLAALLEISVALLYQMSIAKGASARNINDAMARMIEQKCGLPERWLDKNHAEAAVPKPETRSTYADAKLEELATLWKYLNEETKDFLLGKAKYERTIRFTGDPAARSKYQKDLVRLTESTRRLEESIRKPATED